MSKDSPDILQCPCQEIHKVEHDDILLKLEKIRETCPALKSILIPDRGWHEYKNWHKKDDTVAFHRSILLMGLKDGFLGNITILIHKYCLDKHDINPNVKKQYIKDLEEKWFSKTDYKERHKKYRIFMGKIVELAFSNWLESKEYTISNLEAWSGQYDITAYKEKLTYNFEIKFIGQEDEDFKHIVNNLRGGTSVGGVSPYIAANFLLFRVYEAAKQLENAKGPEHRVATIIIDGMAFPYFKILILDHWIDWFEHPTFNETSDPTWEEFIASQRSKKYPDIDHELPELLKKLSAIKIMKINGFQLEEVIKYKNPNI